MKLSDEVVDFILNGNGNNVVLVSTSSEFGVVNLSPRFILKVDREGISDKLYFISLLPNKTLFNLRKNQKVCISKWINELNMKSKMVVIVGRANNIAANTEKYNKLMEEFLPVLGRVIDGIPFFKKENIKVPPPLYITEVIVEGVVSSFNLS